MDNFTPRAQQVLQLARKQADSFNHGYVGTEHILLGLIALGLKPGEAVIVPSFTFASTAEAVCMLGGIPFFSDVKLNTFNKMIKVKNLQSFIHTNTPNIKKYYLKRCIF